MNVDVPKQREENRTNLDVEEYAEKLPKHLTCRSSEEGYSWFKSSIRTKEA